MTDPADRDPVLMAVADGLETTAATRHNLRSNLLAHLSGGILLAVPEGVDNLARATLTILRDFDRLLSERHRAEEAKWLPIDTAPKDGTRLLLCWAEADGLGEHVELGRWRGGWGNTYGRPFVGDPDYFMPLPLTPEPTHER